MGLKNDTKETTNEALGLSMYSNSESTSIVLMTGIGPIQHNVLQDLFTWLSDPVRDFKKLSILSSHMH
jgi:hypothetical protein